MGDELTDEEIEYLVDGIDFDAEKKSEDILKVGLLEDYQTLENLKAFKDGEINNLISKELNNEYQRAFNLVVTLKDANEVKENVEYMKGIGFAMSIVKNLIINLEDDIENKKQNLEEQELGE